MSVLFGRGAFGAESVRLSAQSLAAYALGLPAFVLVKVVAPGFFARGDMATPVKIGVAAVALNLAMNVVFTLGAAGAYRPGAGDQPGGDVQCGVAGRGAGAARAPAAGRAIAAAQGADAGGGGGDGGGAVAGAAVAVRDAAARGGADGGLAALVGVGLVRLAGQPWCLAPADWRALVTLLRLAKLRRGRT